MTAFSEDFAMRPAQAVATYKRIMRLGEKAGKLSDEIWGEWKKLGAHIIERQQMAATKAGGAKRGPTYSQQLAKAMGSFYECYQKLGRDGYTSTLVRCLEEPAVEKWRNRLPPEERPSSPRRVWDAYRYSLRSSPSSRTRLLSATLASATARMTMRRKRARARPAPTAAAT